MKKPKYLIKYIWGGYVRSHASAILTTNDISEAKRFDNKRQINSFRNYWCNGDTATTEIISINE